MIICDKCKKEIKVGQSHTSIRHDYEQKHYCQKCSPINWSIIGIVGLILLVILVVVLSSLLFFWVDGF